jgi:hypothetical protein
MNLRRTASWLAVAFALGLGSALAAPSPTTILNAATTTSATPPVTACLEQSTSNRPYPFQAFQLVETGTGAVTATVQIQSSNDGVSWVNYGAAVTLSGTTTAVNSAYGNAPFNCFGAIVTAITGTGAAVTVKMDAAP